MDFSITQEVLRAYGDAVKEQVRRVLQGDRGGARGRAGDRRDGDGRVRHRGFLDGADGCAAAAGAGVDSPTLKKEIFKKLALKYLERCAAGREGSDRRRRSKRLRQETKMADETEDIRAMCRR